MTTAQRKGVKEKREMKNDVQWTVAVDVVAAENGIKQLALLLGIYYRAVLRETNNQALAEKLTVEYQQIVIGPAFGAKKE